MAQPRERPHEAGVVDVAAGAAQQVAVEDQNSHCGGCRVRSAIVPRRCPTARSTDCARAPTVRSIREVEPGVRYVDRETGEELKVVAKVLPLAPSPSDLP